MNYGRTAQDGISMCIFSIASNKTTNKRDYFLCEAMVFEAASECTLYRSSSVALDINQTLFHFTVAISCATFNNWPIKQEPMIKRGLVRQLLDPL